MNKFQTENVLSSQSDNQRRKLNSQKDGRISITGKQFCSKTIYFIEGSQAQSFSNIIKLQMQVNCCVFPAPKQFDLVSVIDKILLIPKNGSKKAEYYHHKYIMNRHTDNNEFMTHVRNNKGFICLNSSSVETAPSKQKKFDIYSDSKAKQVMNNENINVHLAKIMQNQYTQNNTKKVKDEIPCVFIPGSSQNKIIVFFHGNGEDLCSSEQFGSFISKQLQISVLIVEYQGYSLYEGDANTKNILQDSKTIINFLLEYGYQMKDIILFGRSIGGAIAFETSSQYDPSCLILLSPFLSLKKVAQDLYGRGASCLLKETLDNSAIAQTIKCPLLVIHGMKDNIVPYHHSVAILGQCKGFTRLKLVQNMTHTKFNFRYDLLFPVKKFLVDLGLIMKTE